MRHPPSDWHHLQDGRKDGNGVGGGEMKTAAAKNDESFEDPGALSTSGMTRIFLGFSAAPSSRCIRRQDLRFIDENRPYIIIDGDQWSWGKIDVESEGNLHHWKLPTADKLTLLADLREGADRRVWRACTDSGFGCCIKFPLRSGNDEGTDAAQLAQ